MEQTKRALVRKWLDPSGAMAQNTVDLLIHRNKEINLYAENQLHVRAAHFHPVALFAGERMVSV